MEQQNILFIAEVLTDELKEEIRNYKPYHQRYVDELIKATKDLYEYGGFYTSELEKWIKEYNETKQWNEDKCQGE